MEIKFNFSLNRHILSIFFIFTIIFFKQNFAEAQMLPSPNQSKASKEDVLQCVSWLSEIDKLNKADIILDEQYIPSRVGNILMDNNVGFSNEEERKIIALEMLVNPAIGPCYKTGLDMEGLKMAEKFVKTKDKKEIFQKITSCAKGITILDSAIKSRNKKQLDEAATKYGYLIGIKIGKATNLINAKFKIKEEVSDILTKNLENKKYTLDELKSSEYLKMKEDCTFLYK